MNAARECETKCGSELFECVADCGANTECSSSCYRENIVCVDACPCHTGNEYPFPYEKNNIVSRLSIGLQTMLQPCLQTSISSYHS